MISEINSWRKSSYEFNSYGELIKRYLDSDSIEQREWANGYLMIRKVSYMDVTMFFEYTDIPITSNFEPFSFVIPDFMGMKNKDYNSKAGYEDSNNTFSFTYEMDNIGRPVTIHIYLNIMLSTIYTLNY